MGPFAIIATNYKERGRMMIRPSVLSWRGRLLGAVMLALLLLLGAVVVQAADKNSIKVYVDKNPVTFSVEPRLANGGTLVQMRPLFEPLGIRPAYKTEFQGFGDGPIVALTVKYKILNEAPEAINLATMTSEVHFADGKVTETAQLAPVAAGVVNEDQDEERLAVFLFSEEVLKKYDDFTLRFSGLKTAGGLDAFQNSELVFKITAPY